MEPAAVLSHATVGGFEIAVFSEKDFSQGQAFEARSFRHFPGALYMPKARRELYVELPDEDPMKQKGFVGLLLRSMYGTQDASNLWQEDCTGTLAQRGYTQGWSNPAVFHFHRGDGRMLVHGDDFVLLADDGEIKAVEQLLRIGDGSLQQEAVILNRIVRYVPPNKANRMAMEIEPDQRHVDILLRELQWCGHPESEEVRVARVRRTGIAPSGSRRCAVVPFWSYEHHVCGTGPCGRSRGGQVHLASHAKSNAGGPCRAQTGGAVLVEISACCFGL